MTLANNVRSETVQLNYWVPWGSVLGPLFFILYVNDLQHVLVNTNVQLYADDTVMFISGSVSSESLTNYLRRDLNRLHKWCQSNKLTLNPSKTKVVTFGTRQALKKVKPLPLYLGNDKISSVSSYKYLGFTIDSMLTFRPHIADVMKKVMHKRTMLSKLMPFLNRNVAISIYKMMILPYVDYCDVVYQSACSNDLEKLQRLQNKCLKTCLGLHRLCETELVHSMSKCARLGPRREAHLCNFMFTRQSRINLMDNREIHTRSRDAPLFNVEFPSKETYKRSVLYSGSTTWNSLPGKTRQIDNLHVFKAHQKKTMMVKA